MTRPKTSRSALTTPTSASPGPCHPVSSALATSRLDRGATSPLVLSMADAHRCRGCRSSSGEVVLDLGDQPAADRFPLAASPGPDPRYPLAMWWCSGCGLAQLQDDGTTPDEPRAIEPRAAVRQAHDAVDELLGAGL